MSDVADAVIAFLATVKAEKVVCLCCQRGLFPGAHYEPGTKTILRAVAAL